MLCEDDAEVSAALNRQLVGVGITARAAGTLSDALREADLGNYAAIIVDLNLPDGDGLDLIQQLRSRPQYHDKPIVVISANSKRGREDLRSLALGDLDWLDKPVDLDRLLEVLGHSIAKNADGGRGDRGLLEQTDKKEVA